MIRIKPSSIKKVPENKIVLYTDKRGNVELRADIEKNTLWATQAQIARVFETTIPNISIHIKRIYKERELIKEATIKESLIVQHEGGRTIRRPVILYNLDMAIALGYRVNSKKATQFRIWATGILHDYLVKGYSLNKRRLATSEEKFDDLHEAIEFIESKAKGGPLKAKVTVRLSKDMTIK